MKNRKLLLIVSLVLALTMSLGGTLAYLTDVDSDVNIMTVGNVDITQLENDKADGGFENGKPLYPAYYEGDKWENADAATGMIEKRVNVKNEGPSEAYVRTLIAFEAGNLSKADFDKYIHTEWETEPIWIDGVITVKGVNYYVAYVDYDVVAAGVETAESLQKIVMDKEASNEIVAQFGDTYETLVLSQAIQTNNFPDKATAWKEGFGVMDATNVAEWFGGVAYSTVYEVATEADLKNALEEMKDQPYAVIKLTADVTWETGAGHGSTPIVPADSAVTKLVIDGQGAYTLTATGSGVGSLRAANGGTIAFKDITIDDDSVSYNEGAWELTYLEFAGNLSFDHVTFKSGVQFQTEDNEAVLNATFTNCAFESNEASVYAAWISDGTAIFKNCSFNGTRGIKVHEDYGSEVASVTVDNCTFVLSGKPGMAIGTLNAATKVSITNSAFDTQAGDQNLFIYETDTNVGTFEFSESGNTLAVTVKNAEELQAALAQGGTVVLTTDVSAPLSEKAIYGTPVAVIQKNGGVIDGNGHSLDIENPQYNGYAIETWGGTIRNLTIDTAVGRGIIISSPKADVYIDNVVVDGPGYAINTTEHNGKKLFVSNSTVKGWTSLAGLESATFTKCTFGENTSKYWQNNGYDQDYDRLIRPYVTTEFNTCVFEQGYYIDLSALDADCKVTLNGCTTNGTKITADNYEGYITIELPAGRILADCVIFK